MKRVTVSQARQNWFRLLDEVIAGETIVMERRGARILLRRDSPEKVNGRTPLPDYRSCLVVHDCDHADQWRWDWTPEGIRAFEDAGTAR